MSVNASEGSEQMSISNDGGYIVNGYFALPVTSGIPDSVPGWYTERKEGLKAIDPSTGIEYYHDGTQWHQSGQTEPDRNNVEINELFDNLISGNTLTITNYQPNDIVIVHRNGRYRFRGADYVRTGAIINFTLPFGSSTGGLADGEQVQILSLRQV